LANLDTESPMSISVSERWVMGVGGTSEMSIASRRVAVAERHRILWHAHQPSTFLPPPFELETYCVAARTAGRKTRDETVAVRRSGLNDLEIDAIVV
jgi:hypothetical protein